MYKIDALLKLDKKTFHTSDLAVLWRITNKNTLYTTINRLVKKGVLITIHKGFYSTVPLNQLDPFALGVSFLHRYAYVSLETVLGEAGLISQNVYPITLVSTISKKFHLNDRDYVVRRLKDNLLFSTDGIENRNGVLFATPKRAMSDMLYLNPKYHFDKKI